MDFSSLRILVIDNGGQWTHREYRMLRDLGADVSVVPNTSPVERIMEADGLVLSGGSPSVYRERERLGLLSKYIDAFRKPILGICVGHQFIAEHFGGRTGRGSGGEYGRAYIQVYEAKGVLDGLPSRFIAWESHSDEVKELPPGFELLAGSEECRVEAMMSIERPIFGLQFHPEVEDTEHGREIFINFLREVERWK